jgi:hypothetical protein
MLANDTPFVQSATINGAAIVFAAKANAKRARNNLIFLDFTDATFPPALAE